MATESIRVSGIIPATPKQIYEAWLSSEGHTAFTGSKATVDGRVGGKFTARDGSIRGETLELEPAKRIVQAWRTAEFPKGAAASRLEVSLQLRKNLGTEITFLHSGIPEGLGHKCEESWLDAYLTKMRKYFGVLATRKAEAKAAPAKAETKKVAPKKVTKALRAAAEPAKDAPRPKARPKRPAQAKSTRTKVKPAKRASGPAKKAKGKVKAVSRRVAKKNRPR